MDPDVVLKRINDPKTKVVVYDTETSGLDWKRHVPVGYVFSFGPAPTDSHYVPIRHGGGGNIAGGEPLQQAAAQITKAHPFERALAKSFQRTDLRVVGHNLKFDLHMSANASIIPYGPLECTQINAPLIEENQPSYSLESVARYMGVTPKKGEELYEHLAHLFGGPAGREQMANYWRLAGDDPVGVDYATGDGVSTWGAWEAQQAVLDKEDLRLVWGVECRVLRTLFRMERYGVPVDEEYLGELGMMIEGDLEKAMSYLPSGFNSRSPTDVRKVCEQAGRTDWPVTAKGNSSYPETFLQTFEEGRRIIRVRKLTNLRNSFTGPLKERHVWKGRVHTNFNQMANGEFGTVSGRLSSNEPNLQQVPKRDKELAPIFRRVFVAPPDEDWYSNDYRQQEFVVFTEYTGNPTLVAGYNAEPMIDIHSNVALMLGVERDPTAKRMNLGMVYGMGAQTLAGHLGCDLGLARQYHSTYNREIPEARQFMKDAEATARARGYVRTKLRRRRRFPDPRFCHKAGNGVIQGTSADITKLKMVEIDEYIDSEGAGQLVLQVHDELAWFLGRGPKADKVNKEAQRIMTSFGAKDLIHLKRVPLRIDSKKGLNWREATFG